MILQSLKARQCGEMVALAVHVRLTEMIEFTGKPTGVPADLINRATQKLELETSIPPVPAGIVSLARI